MIGLDRTRLPGIAIRCLEHRCNVHCFWSKAKKHCTKRILPMRIIFSNKINFTTSAGTQVIRVCNAAGRWLQAIVLQTIPFQDIIVFNVRIRVKNIWLVIRICMKKYLKDLSKRFLKKDIWNIKIFYKRLDNIWLKKSHFFIFVTFNNMCQGRCNEVLVNVESSRHDRPWIISG